MKNMDEVMICICLVVSLSSLVVVFDPGRAGAHCDRVSGPVAVAARQAVKSGDFKTAAIWVSEEQSKELRSAFDTSLEVYKMGGKAGELAEQYFMETTVRLHREAEGFPYEGLKPAQPPSRDIAVAESALTSGELDLVLDLLNAEIEQELEEIFQEVRTAEKNKSRSLEAGREWADAYVRYITYVHGIHQAIQAGPEHGVGK